MGWMNEKITLPFLLMGPMLIAIAHNYGTQLIAQYYEDVQKANGPFTRDAIKCIAGNCIISIGSPVLISAVTVIVGFVTMISHPIRGLALLGFFCCVRYHCFFHPDNHSHTGHPLSTQHTTDADPQNHGTKTDEILRSIAQLTIDRKTRHARRCICSCCCLHVFYSENRGRC